MRRALMTSVPYRTTKSTTRVPLSSPAVKRQASAYFDLQHRYQRGQVRCSTRLPWRPPCNAAALCRPAASSSSRRPPNIVPATHGRSCFPGLKLRQGSTAAARVVVVRAQRNAQQPPRASSAGQHFVEEREHVMRRYADIIDIDHGCLVIKQATVT